MPIYDVEALLPRCIDSIRRQTFADFELILVDDGSPDSCADICDEYGSKDLRIVVLHMSNGGLARARNAGLDIATGDFVAFVDSDDYIANDMYEILVGACDSSGADVSVCGRYDVINGRSEPKFCFNEERLWSREEAIERLLTWDHVDSAACDKVFRRHLFDQRRFPVGKFCEDVFIMAPIFHEANRIVHVGHPKYFYCHRPGSLSTEEFSTRKLDLLDAAQEVRVFVSSEYPELTRQADSYYYKAVVYLLGAILRIGGGRQYQEDTYEDLIQILRDQLAAFFSNGYVGVRVKMQAILILTHTYAFARRTLRK